MDLQPFQVLELEPISEDAKKPLVKCKQGRHMAQVQLAVRQAGLASQPLPQVGGPCFPLADL